MNIASRFTDGRALALTLCWVAALAITGSTDVLLFMAPALLIAIPLFGGHYVGEELVVRLAARGRRRRLRRATARPTPHRRRPTLWRPRGTRLIAFSLAKRPPPALAPTYS